MGLTYLGPMSGKYQIFPKSGSASVKYKYLSRIVFLKDEMAKKTCLVGDGDCRTQMNDEVRSPYLNYIWRGSFGH
jgi:hypothetical protein